ncbi:YeiH family protein [Desulfovibrio sp. OttesenSCG-928-F07]|nr:YeiH family protein [Desulfovibrio sp. OttesenSCG-928-F07]
MSNEAKVSQDQNIVVDDGRSKISDLWKKEDYWAIWLGFFILIIGYFCFVSSIPDSYKTTIDKANATMAAEASKSPFKTLEFYSAQSSKSKVVATSNDAGKFISKYLSRPGGWSANPLDSFYISDAAAKAASAPFKDKAETAKADIATALDAAKTAQAEAADAEFKDAELNAKAEKAIADYRKINTEKSKVVSKANVKAKNIFPSLLVALVFFTVLFSVGTAFMGRSVFEFSKGFAFVFAFAVLAFMFGSQATMKKYGIGSEAWAIALGMLLANTIGTPKFVKPALQTEFYIKTGLVLLGAEVLFDKIVAIGIPGIFVAWVVTPVVLITTFAFGQKVLKIESKTLNMVISADMSVCGTSAAIATAAACRAKKEELTLSIGLSLVFTAIMMIVMPAFIKAVGIPEVLGGAWIGGTIDATGAVAAAGAFLGPKAMYVAATIKMIQNVLIGVTAFGVAIYWCTRVDCVPGQRVQKREIWDRFPKFVIGFLTASIIASLISGSLGTDLSNAVVSNGLVKGIASPVRSWCFALAFTSIGLSTNFRELGKYLKGGKPVILYVCGQSFNLMLTITMAYIMFYKVFPEITAKI